MGGREFDGAITINRWYEAKSGNFWRDHTSTPQNSKDLNQIWVID